MKKFIGAVILLGFIVFGVFCGINQFLFEFNNWTKPIMSYWKLMDAASTLKAKSDYLDTCLENLNKLSFAEAGKLFFITPKSNTKENIKVLNTLQERLHKLKDIDETSFAYSKAIEQITAQESTGEGIWEDLENAWMIKNNIWMYDWISICFWLVYVVLLCVIGFVVVSIYIEY